MFRKKQCRVSGRKDFEEDEEKDEVELENDGRSVPKSSQIGAERACTKFYEKRTNIFFVNLKSKHSLLSVEFFEMANMPFPCNGLCFVVLIYL